MIGGGPRIIRPPAGLEAIARSDASNVTSIDFTVLSASYLRYLLTWDNLLPASDGVLKVRLSADGVTWDTGASDYAYGYVTGTSASTSSGVGSLAGTSIPIGSASNVESTAANAGSSGHMWLHNPCGTTSQKQMSFEATIWTATGALWTVRGAGQRLSTSAFVGVRLVCDTANISGNVRLYGMRK